MSAVHPTFRRPAPRPHPGAHAHTRAQAQRLHRPLQPGLFPAAEDDELIGAAPWLTVYEDEDEEGGLDELLMESVPATQRREAGV
ncbi:hypothetical protein [uncultured Aquincola sp.]|uniref:hypothetical protein n=1 Tax=uncultured Aquincola sp. TaxID=886556 RepID=UPI0032B1C8C0